MYDVIIIGAGPGGIFSAYELMKQDENLKIAVFDAGRSLEQRHCPIDGEKVKSCIGCKTCAIMNGFGGAGAFSDGKYNITNDFGGTLYGNRVLCGGVLPDGLLSHEPQCRGLCLPEHDLYGCLHGSRRMSAA